MDIIKDKIIKVFPSSVELIQAAVADFIQRAQAAVAIKNEFTVVLSGGNTPKAFFDALTASKQKQSIPWQQIKFFFGDERYVPADSPESNFHSAQQHLFAKVGVPAENIYRIPTEFSDPNQAAETYAKQIRQALNLNHTEFPQFDLVYLGLGEDAHTASLLPGIEISKLNKDFQLVTALWAAQFNMYRITLTPKAFNHSACICFLVTGAGKAAAVSQTLEGAFDPVKFPAQLIQNKDGTIIWYLDQAAAGKLIG